MRKPLMVFEDIHATTHRKLFTILGVDWLATPYAWLSLPIFLALGILTGFAGEHSRGTEVWLPIGLGYGLLLYLVNTLHSIGHILSGKLVRAQMDANLVTATLHVNLYYGEPKNFSKWVHIGRALGGPIFNVVMGLIALGLWKISGSYFLAAFANLNVLVGIASLAPVPTLDGWVVWGKLMGADLDL
jgi:Zn-dependent protease